MSIKVPRATNAARVDQLSRLADALDALARRWRREAEDPAVAQILRERFGSAVAELFAVRHMVAGRLNVSSSSSAPLPLDLLLRLDVTLATLAELAKEPPAPTIAAKNTVVDFNSRIRVKRLEAATRRQLKRLVQLLAVGVIGAAAFAALPAAAVAVGDDVVNPLTGTNEEVSEVVSPSVVYTTDNHFILLATTVGDTFTDPETLKVYTVTAVTTDATTNLVSGVTVKDSSSVSSNLPIVTDNTAGAHTAAMADPSGTSGSGTSSFTFVPAAGDINNYVNSKTGGNGGDGSDGGGVRVCIPVIGCATIAKSPSAGGDGAPGPDLNVTLNSPSGVPKPPNWGDIQTVSDGLAGAFISSSGGDGGQGGDAYGNIDAAPGGKSGKGGDIVFNSSVKITTAGTEAYGIFAKSSSGKGGQGGKGFILSSGGSGGPPALAGTVTVTNTGIITTTGKGAIGILAESLGGKAGDGGGSYGIIADGGGGNLGGDGSTVVVHQDGIVHTTGELAHGVLSQSIGGDGGNAGSSGGIATFGSAGAAGGKGGSASIVAGDGSQTVTEGDDAFGLFAQSVGGGGGNGGHSTGLVTLGSGGGAGGAGGTATITVAGGAEVTTTGAGSTGVFAQSVGGGGGNSGESSGAINLGGSGDAGGAGADATVTIGGTVSTGGVEARGVFAQSVGGGGGSARGSGGLVSLGGSGAGGGIGGAVTVTIEDTGSVSTGGIGSDAVFAQSVGGGGGAGASTNGLVSLGGSGGGGGNGGLVTVTNSGAIATTQDMARGIVAQSVGGGGGSGGDAASVGLVVSVAVGGKGAAGGLGGNVTVSNDGSISTDGVRSSAIYAQSVGGGGGSGGFSAAATVGVYGAVGIAVGGEGAAGGAGGTVHVTAGGDLTTLGTDSKGIYAQSVGGGGGDGGYAMAASLAVGDIGAIGGSVAVGGKGGAGGIGGLVQIDSTSDSKINTSGARSDGVFAQSVGGGGGNGGWSGALAAAGGGGGAGAVGVSIGGSAGDGGAGGIVNVTLDGLVHTRGVDSAGIFAQSVGGGGGTGGFSVAAGLAGAGTAAGAASVGVGGSGGKGGNAGAVTVNNAANILTDGARSDGIFAQAVGGGGGSGGWSGTLAAAVSGGASGAVGVSIGGSGGDGGTGGKVVVDNSGDISTNGVDSFGIFSQSVGGGGGTGGFPAAGALAGGGGGAAAGAVTVGGSGGKGGAGGDVDVTHTGQIFTTGDRSAGIFIQSVGGGGGAGGWSGALAGAVGSGAGAVGVATGGSGGDGGKGGIVTVGSTGLIHTLSVDADGIFAQSIGGGGGAGGFAATGTLAVGDAGAVAASVATGGSGGGGGDAGTVDITSSGDIITEGDRSSGIFAQAIGGGGGSGGWSGTLAAAVGSTAAAVSVSIGGSGGHGGLGGVVHVDSSGDITTLGSDAKGILAQSIGGGGGTGGFSLAAGAATGVAASVSVGGSGAGGGNAEAVTVNTDGAIETFGDRSTGVFAQSIGGGGGNGGGSSAISLGTGVAVGVSIGGSAGLGGKGGDVTLTGAGPVTTHGVDAAGLLAQSIGGGGGNGGFSVAAALGVGAVAVSIGGSAGGGGDAGTVIVDTSGDILTEGDRSSGVFAQAVGGGGGNGGWSSSIAGGVGGAASISIGGSGGQGGLGGVVSIDTAGAIRTYGADAYGILAQSIGGGGGSGGFSSASGLAGGGGAIAGSVSVGGSGTGGGDAKSVTVNTSGDIETSGARAAGVFAQSVGGGGGNGGGSAAVSAAGGSGAGAIGVSVGGSAGLGGVGGDVKLTSKGDVTTHGTDAAGLLAQSIGGGGGTGGFSLTGALALGSNAAAAAVSIGGSAGGGGNAGIVTVDTQGNILTEGDRSSGVYAQAVGGGGGNGGWSGALGVAGGSNAGAVSVSVGGSGGQGGLGGIVNVSNSGAITTLGSDADGILAQSIGGGGGSGGFSIAAGGAVGSNAITGAVSVGGSGSGGGDAKAVTVNTDGAIETSGDRSAGVFAQSVGGGGGNGGASGAGSLAIGSKAASVAVSVGGSAGLGGIGGDVTVTGIGAVTTRGNDAAGLLAQSIGGGGGTGGMSMAAAIAAGKTVGSVSVGVGGSGGAGGAAGQVTVDTTGQLITLGDRSYGVQAQSIGGGGGSGGFSGAVSATASTGTGNPITLAAAIGGSGGTGGDGGGVTVISRTGVSTSGEAAHALFAQSVGGGGGSGGMSIAGALTEGSNAITVSAGIGGFGGVGGNGGNVSLTANGLTTTTGDFAYGAFAQSVGGGGGDGGLAGALSGALGAKDNISIGLSVGGFGGAGGKGGDVVLASNGDIGTTGADSFGVFAQSVGGGGGNGGMSLSAAVGEAKSKNLAVSLGGFGGAGSAAGDVTVTASGNIVTEGDGAMAIFAQSVGGGGGNGGAAGAMAMSGGESTNLAITTGGHGGSGSIGGAVTVSNSGQIVTQGEGAYGIYAESVGGGGGHGGMAGIDESSWSKYLAGGSGTIAIGSKTTNISVAMGGSGGTGDDSGIVTVNNTGSIATSGALSTVIFAQSIGGGGGDAGVATAAAGAFGASENGTYAIAMGGFGGEAGDGNEVSVTNSGILTSIGDGSAAIVAQSVGGGGGSGGDARGFSMSFAAKGAPEGQKSKNVSVNVSIGGQGGAAGDGGQVDVLNSGSIVTVGADSFGIFAQSVGGGGGSGGRISTQGEEIVSILDEFNKGEAKGGQIAIGGSGAGGGNGGLVFVTNTGSIQTAGEGAHGVFAQSVGGGGGDGGSGLAGTVSIGGHGGVAGDGGDVSVVNRGTIVTQGDIARGIFAQSVGGGGGTGGATDFDGDANYSYHESLSKSMELIHNGLDTIDLLKSFKEPDFGVSIGGAGGSAGDGGNVTVTNNGAIRTYGTLSHGIFAQSVGGGGGTGGEGTITNVGQVVFSGVGGSAGNGGNVTVTNNGRIETSGFGAYGFFAQSVGGGGGVAGDTSLGLAGWGDTAGVNTGININPLDGHAGDGGNVTVTNNGDIILHGAGSLGIFAQSVGGGGGLFSAGVLAFAGTMGGEGNSGTVTVIQNGNVIADGINGVGAFFQSRAGGSDANSVVSTNSAGIQTNVAAVTPIFTAQDMIVTLNGDVHGGDDFGRGLVIDGGHNNVFDLLGTVSAVSGMAIVATDGNDTINSHKGVIGNVDLGTGLNAFNNLSASTFQTSDYVKLNGGLLTNDGVINPGGVGTVQVTQVDGSLKQSASATVLTDLDLHRTGLSGEIDSLVLTGTADVKGTFVLNTLNPGYILPGDHTVSIIHSAGALSASDTVLDAPVSAITKFALVSGVHDESLAYSVNFALPGFSPNETAIGDYINAIQTAGGSESFAPIAAQIYAVPDAKGVGALYDSFSSEPMLAPVLSTLFAGDYLNNALLSCRTQNGGTFRFLDEGACSWFQISPRRVQRDAVTPGFDSDEDLVTVSAGSQVAVSDNLRLGFGLGYQDSAVDAGTTLHSASSRGMAGLSVKYVSDPVLAALTVSGGFGKGDTTRLVQGMAATSTQHSAFVSGQFRLATQWATDDLYVRPLVDVAGGMAWFDGFREQGAGPLSLVFGDARYSYANVTPAVEFGGEFPILSDDVLRPFVRVGMMQFLTGSHQDISAGFAGAPSGVLPFVTRTSLDQTLTTINAGVDLLSGDDVAVRFDYSLQLGPHTHSEGVTLKLSTSW